MITALQYTFMFNNIARRCADRFCGRLRKQKPNFGADPLTADVSRKPTVSFLDKFCSYEKFCGKTMDNFCRRVGCHWQTFWGLTTCNINWLDPLLSIVWWSTTKGAKIMSSRTIRYPCVHRQCNPHWAAYFCVRCELRPASAITNENWWINFYTCLCKHAYICLTAYAWLCWTLRSVKTNKQQ